MSHGRGLPQPARHRHRRGHRHRGPRPTASSRCTGRGVVFVLDCRNADHRRPRRPARCPAAGLRRSRALAARRRYVRPLARFASSTSSRSTPTWSVGGRSPDGHRPDRAPALAPAPPDAQPRRSHGRAPHPHRSRCTRPHDRRVAGLPRREHLVVRARRSTSSSTSACSRRTPPTPSPGSPTGWSSCCPGLREPHLLAGREGRLRRADARGHLARPRRRARRPAAAAGGRARPAPRQDARASRARPGVYNVIYDYADEAVGLAAGTLAVRLVNHLVQAEEGFDFAEELDVFLRRAAAHGLRAVDRRRSSRRRSRRDIPYIRLNCGVPRPARPGRPRPAHPRDDDLEDRRPRRRHRQRQGPDDASCWARPGCPVPQAGDGAHRRRSGGRRRADRLPRRGQAARRQPRPRGLPRPRRREDEVRARLRHRRGRVAAGLRHRRVLRDRSRLPLPHRRRPDAGHRRARPGPRRRRRHPHRRRARRDHQRRPAARRRAREGAHPDQGRRRGDRAGAATRASSSTTCRPRTRWSSSP